MLVWNRQGSKRSWLEQRSGSIAIICLTAALGGVPLVPVAAQSGTLTGRVIDRRTGAAISTAQLAIAGTSLGASANVEGRFRVANVPPGSYVVRARSIGYEPGSATFSIAAGGTADVSISMDASATALDAVVV